MLDGEDIARILNRSGPVVRCVILRARATAETDDVSPTSATSSKPQSDESSSTTQTTATTMIDEISIDTTPKKREVETTLGGPITFLGQYEEEGVVAMVRKNSEGLETNPFTLPHPLNEEEVRGDILLMKVKEESGDFFADFGKNEYFEMKEKRKGNEEEKISAKEEDEEEEEEEDESDEEEEDEDDEENEDYLMVDEEDMEDLDDEEQKVGLMNLCMGQILRRFHEEHGRGPETPELLEIRKTLAEKLGVDVPEIPDQPEIGTKKRKERSESTEELEDEDEDGPRKRVKFSATNQERLIPAREITHDEDHDSSSDSDDEEFKVADDEEVENALHERGSSHEQDEALHLCNESLKEDAENGDVVPLTNEVQVIAPTQNKEKSDIALCAQEVQG